MSHQPEAILENKLVKQLTGLGYQRVSILNEAQFLQNLKEQLEVFNETVFTTREFATILNHLAKGNVFEKAKTLRDRYVITRENGEHFYVRFFNNEDWSKNLFQVTNQVTQEGSYTNRYDVTLLVNGLPLVQIELKRRGLELKEAFNQINRYQRHSFWSNNGLFHYVQIFVISNGVNTKYYSNNRDQSFKQTFYWADVHNRNITPLTDFTIAFLNPDHINAMVTNYIIPNEGSKSMMVVRPYQYYAIEALVRQVQTSDENGYIWHTTGSGKTLTSFKASQIIMNLPDIHKVVFVVDRKDLDYQTMKEFNAFKKDSVDVTGDTRSLVNQFKDDTKLILTTIQKLNNAISKNHYEKQLAHLKDKKIVFVFDECHRSQFGDTHQRIKEYFTNHQLFGFTGTPIFAENASKNERGKRTTKDLFGDCLHKYVITDAIRDENVLKFNVEYIGKYKQAGNRFIDIDVEDIDKAEVLNSPKRLEKIVDYIIKYHDVKTFNREYSAIFAVNSIDSLITYYELFKSKRLAGEHDLRIASIFTYGANEDDDDANDLYTEEIAQAAEPPLAYSSTHTRDKLDEFIEDYNKLYGVKYSTKDSKSFQDYFKDLSKRMKEREKKTFNDEKDRLDILLVVNMMLTGFDAKKLNTLYVDKNLKYHGLIQAFSRTNRILKDKKSQGNILSFRNLKKATDEALRLFSDKNANEEIFLPPYETVLREFTNKFVDLLKVAPTINSIDDFPSEIQEMEFVQSFRALIRVKNVLGSYTDFEWEDLPMSEQSFEDYKSKYLDLYSKVKSANQVQKASILDDIDFEVELIHRDEINVAYIIKLLAQLSSTTSGPKFESQKKNILDMLSGELNVRSKRELIEKFIQEHLPRVTDPERVEDEFQKFWEDQKVLALHKMCEEENLDEEQFKALIDAYIFSGQEPIKEDIYKCMDNRPSILQARAIGDRIIEKMKEYVEVFVNGVSA